MIGTLWLTAQLIVAGAIVLGVISNRWTGWAERPWWYVLAALWFALTTGRCLANGRQIQAAAFSAFTLLAVVGLVLTLRRDRASQARHIERWDPLR